MRGTPDDDTLSVMTTAGTGLRRATRQLAVGTAILAVALPAVALGQAGSRQAATFAFDQQRPARSTGASLAIDYANPQDPAAKPPAVQRVVIKLAAGTAIDDSVPARCAASDQELIARGPEACPGASVIGGGEIDVDTGAEGPGRVLQNRVTVFNNTGQLILLLETTSGAPRRLVARSVVKGDTITTDVPPTPGGPPDGFSAIKRVRLRLEPLSTGHGTDVRNYLTTPSSCPADGAWANELSFTYRDGGSYTVPSPSPCARSTTDGTVGGSAERDSTPPRIRLRGVPKGRCADAGFVVRVGVTERGSGLRQVRLSRDRRRVLVTRRGGFSRRIQVRRLRPGRHALTVVAVDRSGNRAVKRTRFRRCPTPASRS